MSSDLSASYPTGEYLIGNFITDYVNGYSYFDRNVVRKYGDRGLEVDSDATLDEVCLDWLQDVNSIVFSHLNDWAKMYSASLKDYEPLWNVDGTVVTTYGETENTKVMGATQATDVFGNTSETTQYGQKQRTDVMGGRSESDSYGATQVTDNFGGTSETLGSHTDTTTEHARSYSSGTTVEPKGEDTVYGQQVNSTTTHSDTHSEIAHTDQHTATTYTDTHTDAQSSDTRSATAHTDTHSEIAHTDTDSNAEHVDTERRTGNIGVTKSTELIESEYKLRLTYNFFELIFKYMIKEMGVIYYDWNRRF